MFLKINRSTFTIGITGYDLTKLKEYKTADIIHIHWLNQVSSILNLLKNKEACGLDYERYVAFNSGAHYTIDFESFERSSLSRVFKRFKKKTILNKCNFLRLVTG